MRTIPDAVLDKIVKHRPHLQMMISNLHDYPDQAAQIEMALARAYLYGETHLSAMETWYLSQVAHGGPWGGEWCSLAEAAQTTGYNPGTLRRMLHDKKMSGVKYVKTWYIRRDALDALIAEKRGKDGAAGQT